MSTTKKKIGDRIRITGGRHKDRGGVITGKERRGWTVELEACSNEGGERRQVNVPFPMVALVEASAQAQQAGGERAQGNAEAESTVAAAGVPQETVPAAGATVHSDPTDNAADQSIQADADGNEPESQASSASGKEPEDITKLTVKQLQALAKQRGIGIARTKADFLRIIKAKHPDEDLERLKGKTLFDRVGELHISRLRSKDDLLRLLQTSSDSLIPRSPAEFPDGVVREGNTAHQDVHRIGIQAEVIDGILAVRRSGLTNMLDQPVVARIAGELGFPDAARWIEAHPKEYAEGVFRGFEAAYKDRKS